MRKFLEWRFRNRVGLFGSLWYLAMAIVMFCLAERAPHIMALCIFFGIMALAVSMLWFFMWE